MYTTPKMLCQPTGGTIDFWGGSRKSVGRLAGMFTKLISGSIGQFIAPVVTEEERFKQFVMTGREAQAVAMIESTSPKLELDFTKPLEAKSGLPPLHAAAQLGLGRCVTLRAGRPAIRASAPAARPRLASFFFDRSLTALSHALDLDTTATALEGSRTRSSPTARRSRAAARRSS